MSFSHKKIISAAWLPNKMYNKRVINYQTSHYITAFDQIKSQGCAVVQMEYSFEEYSTSCSLLIIFNASIKEWIWFA